MNFSVKLPNGVMFSILPSGVAEGAEFSDTDAAHRVVAKRRGSVIVEKPLGVRRKYIKKRNRIHNGSGPEPAEDKPRTSPNGQD